MASDLDDLADPERRLCEVLAAYFEAVKAGQAPERDAWLARYPDLAGQLAAFLEQQDRLLRVTEPLRSIVEGAGGRVPSRSMAIACRPAPNGNGTDHDTAGAAVHVFGDYELIGEIARGGMSVVYQRAAAEPQPPRGAEDAPRRDAGRPRTTCAGFASRPRRSPTSTTRTSCRSTRSASTTASATSR